MDKSIKKYLTKIIKESYISDIDEMASTYVDYEKLKREKSIDPVSGKEKLTASIALPRDNANPNFTGGGSDRVKLFIADFYILNPELETETIIGPDGKKFKYTTNEGEQIIVIPSTCKDESVFKDENSEWVSELEEKYGLKIFHYYCEEIPADSPRNNRSITQIGTNITDPIVRGLGTSVKPPRKKLTLETKNKANLFKIFSSQIEDSGLNETLFLKSIPEIRWGSYNREYLDNHLDSWTNEKINFKSLNMNGYPDAFLFLNSILDGFEENDNRKYEFKDGTKRIRQKKEGVVSKHSPRNFNTKNTNWELQRMMDSKYEGKTKIRKSDKRGYEESNVDIQIVSLFEVNGRMTNENNFTWDINLDVTVGKKFPEQSKMFESFNNVNNIQITKTAQIGTDEDVKNHIIENGIITNNSVATALIEALYDLKTKIDSISLEELLPYADIEYIQTRNLNESKERLIQRIVKQIKL